MKKIIYSITFALSILAVIGGATIYQMIPLVFFLILGYFNIWQGRKNNVWIVLLAIIMTIANLLVNNPVDVLVWFLIILAFWKNDKP